jgi:glutamate-ammonia-ligase adenylyltransferase
MYAPAQHQVLRMTPAELARVEAFSRYAARLLAARPQWRDELVERVEFPFEAAEIERALAVPQPDAASLQRVLRELRQRLMLRVLARDLTGRADLAEVTRTTTALADATLASAVRHCHAWLAAIHGEPIGAESGRPQQLMVIGMGKLGGCELNVSSDVDLVYVYPEQGETTGPRVLSNQEFFERLGRQVIQALHAVTADGFVFRVDMRLRPYGDSGPLSCNLAMLENYLITQGRAWERYAWLKARVLTGDAEPALQALVQPFVYRKYLDFDAYASLRDIHRQIREQGARRDYAHNIKLGPGGIREIEFIVQVFQLVRGGHDAELRERNTLAALARIVERQLLPAPVAESLRRAYHFLRDLEHRLQYFDDQQTQTLPDCAQWPELALTMGFADAGAFAGALDAHRAEVERQFEGIFGQPADNGSGEPQFAAAWRDPEAPLGPTLAALGYQAPAGVAERLEQVRRSQRYRQLPSASRDRFDALVPLMVREAVDFENAEDVVARMLTLLEAVSRRSAYLALMLEHPPVLPRIAQIVAASPWAAGYLTRHPILLDELINANVLLTEPDWAAWRIELAGLLDGHAGDTERQLDDLRHFQHSQSFRLLAQDLFGRLRLERLADHLSALADVILDATLRHCWLSMPVRHVESPRFAIIGYGKLGGKELGYASDLDLVFLYDDPEEGASERYARLSQRINTWLTATTAAGHLYDTDLRLRPDGAAGLMVSSLDAFRRYQRGHAWLWEHQALTRARFVCGDPQLGAAFEAEREAILRLPRERETLHAGVAEMRRKMAAGHRNPTPLFDVKHDRGGMVDVEFSVQCLVLEHSCREPELTRNLGNIALLGIAERLGLMPAGLGTRAGDVYREYRRIQHHLRMQGHAQARVDSAEFAQARDTVDELWITIFGAPWAP